MAKYEKVGEVYRRKPNNNKWVWIVGVIIFLAIIGKCSGS
tara:strand:- start:864 stop:983 length:120 start_codon:yes stop_codon:yes gene_type:complete